MWLFFETPRSAPTEKNTDTQTKKVTRIIKRRQLTWTSNCALRHMRIEQSGTTFGISRNRLCVLYSLFLCLYDCELLSCNNGHSCRHEAVYYAMSHRKHYKGGESEWIERARKRMNMVVVVWW